LFLDIYKSYADIALHTPQLVLERRMEFFQQLGMPVSAHVYLIAHSPVKLHPDFDQVLRKVLSHDRLGYLLIADTSRPRIGWQQALVTRVVGNVSNHRILFYGASSAEEMVRIMQTAHVLLEPFPITGTFHTTLEALAVGVPVITWPASKHVASRLPYVLYHMLQYGIASEQTDLYLEEDHEPALRKSVGDDQNHSKIAHRILKRAYYSPLVVSSIQEYVSTALKLAHQPALREFHSYQILRRRTKLFAGDPQVIIAQWYHFLNEAVRNRTSASIAVYAAN
jgi:predicted O-linked N-acetylglucosamine transferase (SPINDLY family)